MTIDQAITASVNSTIESPEFLSWYSGHSWDEGDLCVFNSSFVLRDGVKTNQSTWRLVLTIDGSGNLALTGAAETDKMLSPFKRMPTQSANLPNVVPLDEAVRHQVGELGDVVFTLIGDLAPAAEGVVTVNGLVNIKFLRLDTSQTVPAHLFGGVLTVNETEDEEAIWSAVGGQVGDDKHRPTLAKALEDLEDVAIRNVTVPRVGTRSTSPLLKELCSSRETQAIEYQEALDRWRMSGNSDDDALHHILGLRLFVWVG